MKSLLGVSPENIYNFDESNLSDEPGSTKCFFIRGVKYQQRVMPRSKSNISLMFCENAKRELLPLFVVYKAENMSLEQKAVQISAGTTAILMVGLTLGLLSTGSKVLFYLT